MKRTVQMAKNHGPTLRDKSKFKGFRKVRRIVYPQGYSGPQPSMSVWLPVMGQRDQIGE